MSNGMARALTFLTGLLVGALVLHGPLVDAASELMFGSFNNAAKAVTVTSQGYVNVVLH